MKTHLNQLGYAVLAPGTTAQVFGAGLTQKPASSSKLNEIREEMQRFGVNFPIKNPDSTIGEFSMPPLLGKNIAEHFKAMADKVCGLDAAMLKTFANTELPGIENISIVFRSGWTCYPHDGSASRPVDGITEQIAIFDCETFVKGSDFGHPILATALTPVAYYIWMHEAFVDPHVTYVPQLVPLGRTDGLFIAHNCAYDRARTSEAYKLGKTNRWFDTMSAHINVSGVASAQRWWYLQSDAKKASGFRADPTWANSGSLNNLIDCYNFHCQPIDELTQSDKKIRDTFVTAESMQDFVHAREALVTYALTDVKITFELFSILVLKYLQNNPSLTTLAGHIAIASTKLPVVDNWSEWFDGCEKLWHESISEQELLLSKMAMDTFNSWNAGELLDEDIANDAWLSQLDWTANYKVKKDGSPSSKWYGVPKWVRAVSGKDLVNGKPVINGVSTKNRLSHILLRLKWEDSPVRYFANRGWCFMRDGVYVQVPHPKKEGDNVGCLLTKDYESDFESGTLSSDVPEAAELIKLAINVAYWTSVRSRVREQNIERVKTPAGQEFSLIVPASVPHNTSTNRAGENLWLTVPDAKYDKIGSEIKTRVQAPAGYTLVQSDFDAQEAVIASVFSDSYHSIAGSTQLSHSILAGSKEDGTDMHSMTAKTIGISRNVAKGCNYAMLYGCGAKTLADTIRRGDKSLPMRQAIVLGRKLILVKKGKKASRLSQVLIGGFDSHAYNLMSAIANAPVPINPISGTKMSTAFRPANVGKDFWTSRNNWVIQSAGSAMLHCFLTAMEYLIERYDVSAEFCMSVHDSIMYLALEEEAELVAALFQVAHVWSWALLRYNYDMYELPIANAFLSSIEIDPIFRKSATAPTCTVSQPVVEPHGRSVNIHDLLPVINAL